jgi:hypothetical protein
MPVETILRMARLVFTTLREMRMAGSHILSIQLNTLLSIPYGWIDLARLGRAGAKKTSKLLKEHSGGDFHWIFCFWASTHSALERHSLSK